MHVDMVQKHTYDFMNIHAPLYYKLLKTELFHRGWTESASE